MISIVLSDITAGLQPRIKTLILGLPLLCSVVFGCGQGKPSNDQEALASAHDERMPITIQDLPRRESSRIELSKMEYDSANTSPRVDLLLGTAQSEDQRPIYDAARGEGLLSFGVSSFWLIESRVLTQAASRTFYCDQNSYLFTKKDQSHINAPDGIIDPSQAKIFLRIDDKITEVGEYRPLPSVGTPNTRLERLTHPFLCEEEYADVCTVSLSSHGDITSLNDHGYIEISMKLKDMTEAKVLARSPYQRQVAPFTYFGCQ